MLVFTEDDDLLWAYGNAPLGETTLFTNDPTTFRTYPFEIASEPNTTEISSPYYLALFSIYQGIRSGAGLQSENNLADALVGRFPELCSGTITSIVTGLSQYETVYPWGEIESSNTITPYYILDKEVFTQMPIFIDFDRAKYHEVFPTSELLSYGYDQMDAAFGEGPSIIMGNLNFEPSWEDPEMKVGNLIYQSKGVMGDIREADIYFMEYSASFDGIDLFKNEDINGLYTSFQDWCLTKPGSGLLSLKAMNTNQRLDQTPVTTTGEYLINYGTQDVWAPTVLMMNLRDSSNMLGYNLSTPVGAKAVIGAVASQLDLATYEYNFSLVDVEVEYVQHGNDYWTVLPTETSEEPGVGTLAVTSLSEIGEDAKGLYDLRITVTSEDGNKFIETVSPAFRIIGESSIDSVTDSQQGSPTIYNLQGVRISSPTSGLNILVYPDGTVRKQILR